MLALTALRWLPFCWWQIGWYREIRPSSLCDEGLFFLNRICSIFYEEVIIVRDELKKIKETAIQALEEATSMEHLNEQKIRFLGKKEN